MHHNKATTPPAVPELPPTPPPTDERAPAPRVTQVLAFCEACRAGGAPPVDRQFKLLPNEFDQFESHSAQNPTLQGYVKDKIRFDYDAAREQFLIRMPSKLHDLFALKVSRFIEDQLAVWAKQNDTLGVWAKQIKATSTTDIRLHLTDLDDVRSRRSPDAAFVHVEAEYPGLVIEVSYSQHYRDLSQLAEDYILGTEGDIQTVVGLDLAYNQRGRPNATQDKSAKFSIWHPSFTPNAAEGKEELTCELVLSKQFRDSNGNAIEDVDLVLEPSDFTIPDLSHDWSYAGPIITNTIIPKQPSRSIALSSHELCTFLEEINNLPMATSTGKRRRKTSGLVIIKKKRLRSSSTSLPASDVELNDEVEPSDEDEGDSSGSFIGRQEAVTKVQDLDSIPYARPQRRAAKMARRTH